jgi:hypothetical protein
MLNLVIILLIAIFLHCFFIASFSQFHPSIFVWLRILLLCFFCLLLLRSPHSHDPSNRFGGLVRVDFRLFLKHFFCQCFFFLFLFIYRIIPISCHGLCVWFVDPCWLPGSLNVFFIIIFFFSLISFLNLYF